MSLCCVVLYGIMLKAEMMFTESSCTVIRYNVPPQIELHDADIVPKEGC